MLGKNRDIPLVNILQILTRLLELYQLKIIVFNPLLKIDNTHIRPSRTFSQSKVTGLNSTLMYLVVIKRISSRKMNGCPILAPPLTTYTTEPARSVVSVVSDSLRPLGLQSTRLLCSWDFPGKNPGMGCHLLLQVIFLTQGWNPLLWHWQVDSLPQNHWEVHHTPHSLTLLYS